MHETIIRRGLLAAAGAVAAAAILYGCATTRADDPQVTARATAMMKASFKEHGQAKLDRLNQDDTQRLCSEYAGRALPASVVDKIQKENLATVKYPADGKLVGDWKGGERIAQSGQGFQYSDDPSRPAGANCYACHQLDKRELSFGTLGPSLLAYGRRHRFASADAKAVYERIYNSQAALACANMPRFGTSGFLTIDQIKDLVAYVMSPDSPVNE